MVEGGVTLERAPAQVLGCRFGRLVESLFELHPVGGYERFQFERLDAKISG